MNTRSRIRILLGLAVVTMAFLAIPAITQASTDTFSINFYKYSNDLPFDEDKVTITVEPDQSAGMDDWLTNGWSNVEMGHGMEEGLDPMEITSNMGSTATFHLISARNGNPYDSSDGARDTNVGDGTHDMMDGHVNATEAPNDGGIVIYNTDITDIPFGFWEVIVYMGGDSGDNTGIFVINDGDEQTFQVMPDRFDGTFVEIVDDTAPGNFLTFKGQGPSFNFKAWGNGENHLGPNGFQVRQINDPNAPVVSADDWITWKDKDVPVVATIDDSETEWDMNGTTYLWTTESQAVSFDPAVNPADPNTSTSLTPSVTVAKDTIGDVLSVNLKLTVTVPGETPIETYVTIDVHDTACLASLAKNPDMDYDPGDLTKDCETKIDDLVQLAAAWLTDYSSIGPIPRPEDKE